MDQKGNELSGGGSTGYTVSDEVAVPLGGNANESSRTDSGTPASSDSVLDSASSSAAIETDFSAETDGIGAISSGELLSLFERLTTVFRLPEGQDIRVKAEVYASLLSDLRADRVRYALRHLAMNGREFPLPADVREWANVAAYLP